MTHVKEKIESIAKVCHEANKAYCQTIGDDSQPSWEEAPEWQKQSARNGVMFHLDHPNAKPSDSHDSWLKEKAETGWKYGAVKDPEKKEHPCFVPYEELPSNQKVKDALFIAVVHSMNTGQSKSLTFGQKAVGLNFNPSGSDAVGQCKQKYADAIDQMNDFRSKPDTLPEQKRLASVAITETQGAQMWAVKALTWKD